MKSKAFLVLVICAALLLGPACNDDPSDHSVADYTYKILNEYPHDPQAFTQGLAFVDGVLYEATGSYGQSSIRRVDLETGEVRQSVKIADDLFGEGIAVLDDRLIQLTWRGQKGFVYDPQTFDLLEEFSYPTDGWGITSDGDYLIMSDGTATLRFWDPNTFETVRQVRAHDENSSVRQLNELEYIEGLIFANVWQTDIIVIIDPDTGQVEARLDLTGILSPEDRGMQPVDVLNGIAYDSEHNRLFVTGKLWPKLFEIELVPVE